MRALVVGGGSIGTRHLNNLQTLGLSELALVEPDAHRRVMVTNDKMVTGFETLDQALAWRPDVAIIATPSALHVPQALKLAEHDCHLFIEKPLSHTSAGLVELQQILADRRLVSIVGCNMRFHPGPAQVKQLLAEGSIGKVLFARVYTGSYLPEWRPQQDYRQSYSAQAALGGGCLLDCIHEIDLARWYLGEIVEVFCLAGHVSRLEVDVDDIALLTCRHTSGAVSEIHLDYIQRTYERGCQIVGERGSIFWDYQAGVVRWFDAALTKTWQTFEQPKMWQVNQMYFDEMRHLLACVESGQTTTLPVSEALNVMNIVFAAKESAASGCLTRVQGL